MATKTGLDRPRSARRWGCGVLGSKTSRTPRRAATFVVAAAVLAMPLGMTAANAEPDYPPKFYKITASAYTAKVGQAVQFTAQTFRSGSAVAVDVSAEGASDASSGAQANGKGIAKTSVTFTVAGVNRVTMSGISDTGEDLALWADVTVTEGGDDVVPVTDDGGNGSGDGGNASDDTNAGGVPFLGGGLPRTGAEIAGSVLVAAALIGAGFLLVVATRRRRASH